jgi:hypothetical protein
MAPRIAEGEVVIHVHSRFLEIRVGDQMSAGGVDVPECEPFAANIGQFLNGGTGLRDKQGVKLFVHSALHERLDAVDFVRLHIGEGAEIGEIQRPVP